MRRMLLAVLVFASLSAAAQDVLSIGSGSTQLRVTLTKNTANPVQAVTFKVLFDEDLVASATFTRSGPAAVTTPLYETSFQGTGYFSYAVLFPSSINLAGQLGTLTFTMQPGVTAGTIVPVAFDAPSVLLSNQSASTIETVANGQLALVNGSITATASLAAPANVIATATSTTAITVTWSAVGGATNYEVWRSSNNGAYALIGTTASTSFPNGSLSSNTTYLYRVRATNGAGASPFSSVDAATTIAFTDDPLVAGVTPIEAIHITQLRTAVDAMRAAGGLSVLAPDATIGAGQIVREQHLLTLRAGLNEARVAIGLSLLVYTDAEPQVVKAVHITELRNGVK